MKLTRQEFNQAVGDALRTVRVDRGLSQEEAAEGINAIPVEERRKQDIYMVAVYSTFCVALREELGLTQKQLAKRSGCLSNSCEISKQGKTLIPSSISLQPQCGLRSLSFGFYASSQRVVGDAGRRIVRG